MLPGFGYGGYIRLEEVVEKVRYIFQKLLIEYKNNSIFVNGKVVQGLKISGTLAVIHGIHYTSWNKATQIRSTYRIEPSLDDPFMYIAEPGKMDNWPQDAIKKELGASSADAEVWLTIKVPVNRIWIKVSREVVHFAIGGIIYGDSIIKLDVYKHRVK